MTEELLTEPGSTMGTIAYMSPEQARGQTVDARTDLWSFGVVLYEMVTGSRPFDGPTSPIIFDALLNKTPQSVRERNPMVPAELERIIGKLLKRIARCGTASAAELRDDLERLQTGSESGRPKTTCLQLAYGFARPCGRRGVAILAARAGSCGGTGPAGASIPSRFCRSST